jgi:hypothetical protein
MCQAGGAGLEQVIATAEDAMPPAGRIHAIFFSIFTGSFSTHTGFSSILTGFFSTRVSITLERSRLFYGLFATTAPKIYDYRRSKA